MLQIGIHDNAVVALCVLQSGVDTGLLAEIARERDIAHSLVIFRHDAQRAQCAVLRAVVDEQIFKFQLRMLFLHFRRNLCDLLIEHRQNLLLVIAGDDHRYQLFLFQDSFLLSAALHISRKFA